MATEYHKGNTEQAFTCNVSMVCHGDFKLPTNPHARIDRLTEIEKAITSTLVKSGLIETLGGDTGRVSVSVDPFVRG